MVHIYSLCCSAIFKPVQVFIATSRVAGINQDLALKVFLEFQGRSDVVVSLKCIRASYLFFPCAPLVCLSRPLDRDSLRPF